MCVYTYVYLIYRALFLIELPFIYIMYYIYMCVCVEFINWLLLVCERNSLEAALCVPRATVFRHLFLLYCRSIKGILYCVHVRIPVV